MALNTNLLANIPQVRLDPAAFDTAGTMAKALQMQQMQQQMQQSQRQGQLTQLQIDDLLADRKEMETFRAALVAKGGSPDLNAYADMLLRSPKHMQTGIELKQKLAEQAQFDSIYKQLYPEAAVAPAAALAAEPVGEPSVATAFPVPSSPSAGAVPAPANALAPTSTAAGTAPQAASANALAKSKSVDDLRREIMLFSKSADPRAKAMVNVLQSQLQEAVRQTRPMVVGPNVYNPVTGTFTQAPAAPVKPTPAETEEIVLRLQDPTLTPQLRKTLEARLNILTTREPKEPREPPAPTITQVIDPKNPERMLTVDARRYQQGGSEGAPGVIGVAGKEPSAATRNTKIEQGKTQLQDDLDNLRASFTTLNDKRAIASTERGAISNLMSSAQSSGVGQAFGRAIGTEEQVERDVITSAKQRLMTSIKNATGMSAQQLNSNMELQAMLRSLSDVNLGFEASMRIIDDIENTYVKGAAKKVQPATGNASPTGKSPYQNLSDEELLRQLGVKPGGR